VKGETDGTLVQKKPILFFAMLISSYY